MQGTVRSALPEGTPPEGVRILRSESEGDLERQFTELAREGYVPAQRMDVNAHYDEDEGAWNVLYVLPVWKVGGQEGDRRSEEMFG
jgi:hypothetical protein